MLALIDADMLLYQSAFAGQDRETGEIHSFDYVAENFESNVDMIKRAVEAEDCILYLTGPNNFRFNIAKTKPYKGTRKEEKPYHYDNLKFYIKALPNTVVTDGYEADDAMCIKQIANAKEFGLALNTHAGKVLVDYEDYEKYRKTTFILNNKGYVINDTGKGDTRNVWLLHRDIMGNPKGYVVDHINGDKLDNRKYNLRICTIAENVRNSESRSGTSRYKGVHWDSSRNKWLASLKYQRENKFLGRFDSEEQAAIAYDNAAKLYFGEFARLNFDKPIVKPFQETIICSRDKDLRMCPFWHYGWEHGNQPEFFPTYVERLGEITLSEDKKKIKGTGLKFFYSQLITGDTVDNIPGLPKGGPVLAALTLADAVSEQEM